MITDEPMVSLLERALRQAASLDRRRKVALALAGLASLTMAGACLATPSSRSRYEPLFVDLSDVEKADALSTLRSGGGFSPRVVRVGTIELPEDQIPEARHRLATQGKLPQERGARRIAEDRTDVDALEKRIARTLEATEGVESALVHVFRPGKGPFAAKPTRWTASVFVVEKGGGGNERLVAKLARSAFPDAGVLVVDRETMSDIEAAYRELAEMEARTGPDPMDPQPRDTASAGSVLSKRAPTA